MAEHEKYIKTTNNIDSTTFSSNNYIDKSIIEDLIKCDLCNIIFDSNIHAPLMVKCGHTFCRRCLCIKNYEKTVNKTCPFDKKKNILSLDSAIPNLKLEHIVKKLMNLIKKQIVYTKPVKKGISPIKCHNLNNAVNFYSSINTNININKKKEKYESNSNKKNYINKKKNNKVNNINFVNTIKSKIDALNNIKNNFYNNNINDINILNNLYKSNNRNNDDKTKTMLSEINDNINSPDEEINIRQLILDEKFNKGNNNETFDTIPINEEKSLGDTSFGGDINELLLKSTMTKKKSITEETITEDFNTSSSKNLKKLTLLGNDSINFNSGNNDFMLQSQKLSQPLFTLPYNFSLTPNKNNFNLQNYNQQIEFNRKYSNDNNSSMTNQEEVNELNINQLIS